MILISHIEGWQGIKDFDMNDIFGIIYIKGLLKSWTLV